MSVKCLGEPVYRRFFDARLSQWRQQAPYPELAKSDLRTALWASAAFDGADGLTGLVRSLPSESFVRAHRDIADIADRIAAEADFGAFLLAEERAIEQTSRAALQALESYAREQVAATLAAEDRGVQSAARLHRSDKRCKVSTVSAA